MNNNYNYNPKSTAETLRRLFALRTEKKGLVLRLPEVVAKTGDGSDTLSSQVLVPHRSSASVWGRVFYHGAKIAAFALLILSVVSGTDKIGNTISYYANVERSLNNLLVADPVIFTLTPGSRNINMSSSSANIVAQLIPDVTSEPLKYIISSIMTGGNETLCSLVNVSAPTYGYSGSLLLFSTVATTSLLEIPLTFTFPEGLSPEDNTSCFMDLVFTGKNADAEEGRGYSDKHSLSLQFYIPDPLDPLPPSYVVAFASSTDASTAQEDTDATSTTETVTGSGTGEVAGDATTTPATEPTPPPATVPEYIGGTGIMTPPPPPPAENSETPLDPVIPTETASDTPPVVPPPPPPPEETTPIDTPTDPTPPPAPEPVPPPAPPEEVPPVETAPTPPPAPPEPPSEA